MSTLKLWREFSVDTTVLATILVAVTFLLIMSLPTWLMVRMEKSHQMERERWSQERTDLLNRAMAKDLTGYAQLTQAPNFDPNQWADTYQGMSDQEELERMGRDISNARGYGDPIVELPVEDSELEREFRELGLIDDE